MESSSLTISLFVKPFNRPGSRDHYYQSKHIECTLITRSCSPQSLGELSD
jgi:hypothetical protein